MQCMLCMQEDECSAVAPGRHMYAVSPERYFNFSCKPYGICRRVRRICEKRLLVSSCLSVSAWNNSARTGRIVMKFDI
jgi:hypothetical protein